MARWYGPGDADFTPAPPPTLVDGPVYATQNGRLFLIGGYDAVWAYTNVVQSFDWSTNAWTIHTALDRTVASYTRGVSVGDWIYFECWDDLNYYFLRYNPDTGVTEELADSIANLHSMSALDGVIYHGIASPTPHSYDIATDTWTAITGSPVVDDLYGGGVIEHDGSIISAGGGMPFTNAAWRFVPGANRWDQLPDLPGVRMSPVLSVYRGLLVCIGGYASSGPWVPTELVSVLNAHMDTWQAGLPLPAPIAFGGGGAVGGRVVCAAGLDDAGALAAGTHILGHEMSSVDVAFEVDTDDLGPKAAASLVLQFEVDGGPGAVADLRLLIPVPAVTIANLLMSFEVPALAAEGDAMPVPALGDPEADDHILTPGPPTIRTRRP